MRAIGKGAPVPRHLRNPRRAYDEDGRELAPATVANTQKNGARGIIARCACNHEALLPFTGLHAELVRARHRPAPAVHKLRRQAD